MMIIQRHMIFKTLVYLSDLLTSRLVVYSLLIRYDLDGIKQVSVNLFWLCTLIKQ